jgi:hypothetical protein
MVICACQNLRKQNFVEIFRVEIFWAVFGLWFKKWRCWAYLVWLSPWRHFSFALSWLHMASLLSVSSAVVSSSCFWQTAAEVEERRRSWLSARLYSRLWRFSAGRRGISLAKTRTGGGTDATAVAYVRSFDSVQFWSRTFVEFGVKWKLSISKFVSVLNLVELFFIWFGCVDSCWTSTWEFCPMSDILRTFEWYDDWCGKISNKILSLERTIRVDGEWIVWDLVCLLNGTQISFNCICI